MNNPDKPYNSIIEYLQKNVHRFPKPFDQFAQQWITKNFDQDITLGTEYGTLYLNQLDMNAVIRKVLTWDEYEYHDYPAWYEISSPEREARRYLREITTPLEVERHRHAKEVMDQPDPYDLWLKTTTVYTTWEDCLQEMTRRLGESSHYYDIELFAADTFDWSNKIHGYTDHYQRENSWKDKKIFFDMTLTTYWWDITLHAPESYVNEVIAKYGIDLDDPNDARARAAKDVIAR